MKVGNTTGGEAGKTLTVAARRGYLSGMTFANLVAAVIALIAAVFVWFLLPSNRATANG